MRHATRFLALATLTLSMLACTSGMMTFEQASTIKPGVTKQRLIEAYGKPMQVNTTRTRSGTREQWVYTTPEAVSGLNAKRIYVYFEGNEVTSVQY